ncbi:MAG: hypothetical protein IKU65_02490 [Oscillospiraceae bacterium]|nr:hypothetical protein [Oscillospiraceae bacterium]
MKEVIYTIPINDAYDVKCGCPVCRLENKLDTEAREYVMGAAMMEPDVRIMTNEVGFCPRHFSEMLEMKNRLSLALMLQSYLADLLQDGVVKDTKHISKKEFEKIADKLRTASDGCFICKRVEEKLSLFVKNIIYIWESNEEFRKKTRKQEYFCPKHLALLCHTAKKLISKRNYSAFCEDHFFATRKILNSLSEDVTKFCNSYNYMFRDIPLGEAKTSVERTIDFLNGDIKK